MSVGIKGVEKGYQFKRANERGVAWLWDPSLHYSTHLFFVLFVHSLLAETLTFYLTGWALSRNPAFFTHRWIYWNTFGRHLGHGVTAGPTPSNPLDSPISPPNSSSSSPSSYHRWQASLSISTAPPFIPCKVRSISNPSWAIKTSTILNSYRN